MSIRQADRQTGRQAGKKASQTINHVLIRLNRLSICKEIDDNYDNYNWNCKEMRLYGFIKNAVKKGNNSYYTK
jgi:hypothetical protein